MNNNKKMKYQYHVVYHGSKENGEKQCIGSITIVALKPLSSTQELETSRNIIEERLGKGWKIVILNIIEFPLK